MLSYRIEWIRFSAERLFLLAWKGGKLRVVFADLRNDIGRVSAEEARERFLVLLVHLRKDRRWDEIFRGREVRFQWLTLENPTPRDRRALAAAGVEPFSFLDFLGQGGGQDG